MAGSTPPRHPEYFIKSADLCISCSRVQFKIHSHFFVRESDYWRKELVGPASPDDGPLIKGTNTNPIKLDEKPEDFEQLLWVFYNSKLGDYSKATLQNWETILGYGNKWDFPYVKELAIRHLENHEMDVITRINLYQDNKVPEKHLFRWYRQIISREEMLTLEESRALRIETLVLIHQARERLRAQTSPTDKPLHSPLRKGLKDTDITEVILSTFKLSLSDDQVFVEPFAFCRYLRPLISAFLFFLDINPELNLPPTGHLMMNVGLLVLAANVDEAIRGDWKWENISCDSEILCSWWEK